MTRQQCEQVALPVYLGLVPAQQLPVHGSQGGLAAVHSPSPNHVGAAAQSAELPAAWSAPVAKPGLQQPVQHSKLKLCTHVSL